ncbi:hypothetical protein SAMN04488511_117122 [Pedobacter suwonensis]|uniref:Uncharacterized protein n=1 Tax=Pedobacter suwonensis TaxID=332999 RepID=A0A1I0U0F9_9SPHI|nr:hypothetical protein SAMN04488511_117122 [Pedobacter suwonensis]
MNRISLQLTAFIVLIFNHIVYAILDVKHPFSAIVFATIMICLALIVIFLYDYYCHFKKSGKFTIPLFIPFLYSTLMWLFSGLYFAAGLNVILSIACMFYLRRLKPE